MTEEDMTVLKSLWEKENLTEQEQKLLEQLNKEYDAEFGYFEEDD